jgi:PAS domain S-box-containing protein
VPGFDRIESGPVDSGSFGHGNALLYNSERHAQELTLLHQIRAAIALDTDLSTIFRTVVDEVSAAFGYTLVSLYTLDDGFLVLQHQVGYEQVLERISIERGVAGRVARTGQAVLIGDVSREPDFLAAIPEIRSEICVPFFRSGVVAGIFNVESSSERSLDLQDFRLVQEITGLLNLAVERSALYAAMHASEERLRLALEAADMGAWVWNPATGDVQWSEQMAALYGLPPGTNNITTDEWFNTIHPDDREIIARADRNFLKYGGEYGLEFRVVLPSGAVRWLEGKGRVVERGPKGEVISAVGVTMDITGRKRLEAERLRLAQLETERAQAREAQRAITDTLERMTAGFIAVDRDWRFTYLNQRALAMLLRESIDLNGQQIWGAFPEIVGTEIERSLRGAVRSQRPANFDAFWPGPDRWIEMHVYPAGEGLSIYLQDVTERRHARMSSAESRRGSARSSSTRRTSS